MIEAANNCWIPSLCYNCVSSSIAWCILILGFSSTWSLSYYCVSTSGAQCILIWGNIVPPPRPLCMYGIQHHYCIGIVCIIAFPERSQSSFLFDKTKEGFKSRCKKTFNKVQVRLFWRQGLLDWQQNCVKSSIDFLLSESWQVLLQVSRPTWYMLPVPILTIKVEKTISSLWKAFWIKKRLGDRTTKMKIIKKRRQFHLFEKLSG